MSLSRNLIAAAAILVAVPMVVSSAQAELFRPQTFTLANGLEVIVVERAGAAAVQQLLVYKVGSADEAAQQSGIAHYLEHLMFKGTPNTPPGVFDRAVARQGGRQNAYTSYDQTGYHQTVPTEQLPEMMRLEADRMAGLVLSDANSKPELDVVLQERRQRTDTPPSGRIGEQAQAVLFQHSEYGTPIIGWEHEIRALDWHIAQDFHKTWYAPNNAVLIIDGGVSAADVKRWAEETYAKVPSRPVPERMRKEEPPKAAEVRLEQEHPAVRDPSFSRRWLARGLGQRITNNQPTTESYALQVLGEVLGGGANSRLHKALVLEQNLASGVAASYDPNRLGWSSFVVWGSPASGVARDKFEAALAKELERLIADGVTEAEVDAATARIEASTAYSLDGIGAAGRIFASTISVGIPVSEVEAWPDRIRAVSAADVTAAARAILGQPAVTTWLKPKELS
ncbi:M16 family metallopeptidase [Lacibacterium aquatile]|uniref:M16 family metallopeptidase n=1 Tax=Lacibacterium aquatile TaxID=1168082 RepID=A0ABW5DL00_9PROT